MDFHHSQIIPICSNPIPTMDNQFHDCSFENLWRVWQSFIQGKSQRFFYRKIQFSFLHIQEWKYQLSRQKYSNLENIDLLRYSNWPFLSTKKFRVLIRHTWSCIVILRCYVLASYVPTTLLSHCKILMDIIFLLWFLLRNFNSEISIMNSFFLF